jgi:hypothetical protein
VKWGVYSSASQWAPIFGDWHGADKQELWYAHYDGAQSFHDFHSFGMTNQSIINAASFVAFVQATCFDAVLL